MLPVLAASMFNKSGKSTDATEALQYVAVGGLSLAIIGTGIWLVSKNISDTRQLNSEKKALMGGTPEYYAGLLGNALYTNEWFSRYAFGIDEDNVYNILFSIPKGMMNGVQVEFLKQYKITLANELKEKFWPDEYQKALAIINNKL